MTSEPKSWRLTRHFTLGEQRQQARKETHYPSRGEKLSYNFLGAAGLVTMDPIVELRNVTKRYGGHAALDDFSLEVRPGEFLTLLGASGSGKTTILGHVEQRKLVDVHRPGFEPPDAGQVFIEGRDTRELPPYRRNVNTVFQHYALFPHLSVAKNVAFGLHQKKLSSLEIIKRVGTALDMVGLVGKEGRMPNELSGGEKQRVALARALVLEPAVLLLDEPLGALDQKLRREMQVELKRLRERVGITFVFVTHDQEEALVMSDRIAVIHRGRLVEAGSGEEIYEHPRSRYVAEFMGFENFFDVRAGQLSAGRNRRPCLDVAQGRHTPACRQLPGDADGRPAHSAGVQQRESGGEGACLADRRDLRSRRRYSGGARAHAAEAGGVPRPAP